MAKKDNQNKTKKVKIDLGRTTTKPPSSLKPKDKKANK
ncbi:hypothetical protein SAMN05192545_2540 [Maribacter dokdonensis]|uniref:Uncharacterized protein n=1 Tax=Maribacter dokdonensis TaxID=320912 RepID=A0ABY0UPQ2_9FLAO|nr:hypothetical protein SAMN05192545_2540 [Maribacter dokdonensis]